MLWSEILGVRSALTWRMQTARERLKARSRAARSNRQAAYRRLERPGQPIRRLSV